MNKTPNQFSNLSKVNNQIKKLKLIQTVIKMNNHKNSILSLKYKINLNYFNNLTILFRPNAKKKNSNLKKFNFIYKIL